MGGHPFPKIWRARSSNPRGDRRAATRAPGGGYGYAGSGFVFTLLAAVVVKSPARDGQARATAHSVNSMSMGHS